MTSSLQSLFAVAMLLTACFPTPGARPDDMSADEHRAHADHHDELAAEHARQYDPEARAEEHTGTDTNPALWEVKIYNPTQWHRADAAAHRRHAADHRAAASRLEAFEDQECGKFPPETRPTCPLIGAVERVEDVAGGVQVVIAHGIRPLALADHARCHRAFARTHDHRGMPDCPLYMEGVSISLEGSVLQLTVDDEAALPELRRRAHEHDPGSR
ncbi:MAG: hypothetical protein RIF41_19445 [Polyangiaceae bacterium]